MKKVLRFFLLPLTVCLMFSGCGGSNPESPETPGTPENPGITVNQIEFEIVSDVGANLDQFKPDRGYAYGEKEDNEGLTNISVLETAPKPDDMVTQVITYPHVIVKVTGITDNFNITNQDGVKFPYLGQLEV